MKKERYFSPESIEAKSRDMLQDVTGIKQSNRLQLSAKGSALLVLDMQRYFLNEDSHAFVPSAPAIIPGIAKLISAYSQKGLPIVFTRHTNTEANAGMMSKWWRDLIGPESLMSKIIPELDSSRGLIIEKNQYDAFYRTSLEEVLRGKQISQVTICGVMTHLCCETTARSAFVRGFEVFLAIDGTATYSEPFHRATLWNAAHGFAVPMLVEEMIAALD